MQEPQEEPVLLAPQKNSDLGILDASQGCNDNRD